MANLTVNLANTDAIHDAGAIAPLVALLHAGAESPAAKFAAEALRTVALAPDLAPAVLDAVRSSRAPTASFDELLAVLGEHAEAAAGSARRAAAHHAVERVAAAHVQALAAEGRGERGGRAPHAHGRQLAIEEQARTLGGEVGGRHVQVGLLRRTARSGSFDARQLQARRPF